MTPRGEQLILEYLAKVSDAAQPYLPPIRRASYVAGLRVRIRESCAAAGATEAEQVRRVLRGLGDPGELAVRECTQPPPAETGTVEPDEAEQLRAMGGFARPVRYHRDPPPWRGGPRRSRLRRREPAGAPAEEGAVRLRRQPGDSLFHWLLAGIGTHPIEAAAIALYLVSVLSPAVAMLWLVGAVQVGLSRVWPRRDKWVAAAVPLLGTVVGMATWRSDVEYIYIDQIIAAALFGPGLLGMRLAAFVAGGYLLVRLARVARIEGR